MNDDVQATVARLRAQMTFGSDWRGDQTLSDVATILDALDVERAARVQAEGERDALVQQNDPIWDCTDGAHPAWWRAHDYVSKSICERITDAIDGKEHGAYQEPLATVVARIDDLLKAAANEAALRVALERDRLVMVLIEANDAGHLDWTPRGIADCIIDATAALATPPSAAAERVQRIVAAAKEYFEAVQAMWEIIRRIGSMPKIQVPDDYEAVVNRHTAAESAMRAALDGEKEGA